MFVINNEIDEIIQYRKILIKHHFILKSGYGTKPWSHKWVRNNKAIEVRQTEWTYYKDDVEQLTGNGPDSLDKFLSVNIGGEYIG